MSNELSADLLHELFEYVDGTLVRKVTVGPRGKAGMTVGGSNGNGYMKVQINGKFYQNHRLIFLMHHGYLPKQVDHIDNDPLNNRIENLREASRAENSWNAGVSSTNTSGYKGVGFFKQTGRWRVRVKQHGKTHHGGLYDTAEEANEVAMALREELHGEFVRHE
tara:strand:+ start:4158 stop:4649 length:492 start_codon:yes stop_codon:yes gene_type:complete